MPDLFYLRHPEFVLPRPDAVLREMEVTRSPHDHMVNCRCTVVRRSLRKAGYTTHDLSLIHI